MEAAFEAAKASLCGVMSLMHPDPTAAISLACNALQYPRGAMLQQWSPRGWELLSYYSKKLDGPAQKKYSTFDRDLIAAYLAVCHFRFLPEGRSFHITDQKPLTFALHGTSEPWSAHQLCQLGHVAEFTSDICHVVCFDSVVADSLSMPPAGGVQEPSRSSPAGGQIPKW
jgi:hypothetical protein